MKGNIEYDIGKLKQKKKQWKAKCFHPHGFWMKLSYHHHSSQYTRTTKQDKKYVFEIKHVFNQEINNKISMKKNKKKSENKIKKRLSKMSGWEMEE